MSPTLLTFNSASVFKSTQEGEIALTISSIRLQQCIHSEYSIVSILHSKLLINTVVGAASATVCKGDSDRASRFSNQAWWFPSASWATPARVVSLPSFLRCCISIDSHNSSPLMKPRLSWCCSAGEVICPIVFLGPNGSRSLNLSLRIDMNFFKNFT